MDYKVSVQIYNHMTVMVIDFYPKPSENKISILYQSDHHIDNPDFKSKILNYELAQAKKRDALIMIRGDLFCVMQGPNDPRSTRGHLLESHNSPAYFDAVVDFGVDYFTPYSDKLLLCSVGNHETSVLKHHATDLMGRFVNLLKLRNPSSNITRGSYRGWVVYRFHLSTKIYSYKEYYSHGSGSPASKASKMRKIMSNIIDADFHVRGHVHQKMAEPMYKETLNRKYMPQLKRIYLIQLGTYKDEYLSGEGWSTEKEHAPPSFGGYYITFHIDKSRTEHPLYYTIEDAYNP